MPRYEYECERCGSFEVMQKMADPPLTQHECGAPAHRIISNTSFTLKGGGWYADGYGEKAKKSAETKTEAKAETKAETKSETKSEAKPETKTESKPEPKPDPKPDPKPSGESKAA